MLTLLLSIFISTPLLTQAATKEDAVKAGFVYSFTKFIVWPVNTRVNNNFNLCIVGDSKINGGLEALYGKLVIGKPLVLRHNLKGDALKDCHLAFIRKGDMEYMQQALKSLTNLPILTVSDSPNFIDHGGMIGLIRDGNRVGFEVDVVSANAVGLHMGAQLLKLAKKVKGLE